MARRCEVGARCCQCCQCCRCCRPSWGWSRFAPVAFSAQLLAAPDAEKPRGLQGAMSGCGVEAPERGFCFRPIAEVRFSSVADLCRGPFGMSTLSLGYVSRVAPSAHAQGLRPGRWPGTNSPLDCLCPCSLLRTGLRPVLPLYFAAGATRLPQPATISACDGGVQPCVLQRWAWLGCGAHERLSPDEEQS